MTPDGFRDAYRRLIEGGFIGISVPPEFGGLGLPVAMTEAVNEFLVSANMAFAMYPGLTQGAIAALLTHGTAEQKALYLPKLVGRRMDRHHEPDRGAMRHRPRPHPHQGGAQSDGSFRITGTKIFISAGEHDLADNIVHLVLARIAGAPPGTRGLSLFVVPKIHTRRRRLAGRPQRGVVRRASKTRWASTATPPA